MSRMLPSRTTLPLVSIFGALALLLTAACGNQDAKGRLPLGVPAAGTPTPGATAGSGSAADASTPTLSPVAATALDAGNAAYRAKKYAEALVSYREAAAAAPTHAAPWFGLYMVANEIKNAPLADSAMAQVKALSADPASLDAHAVVASPNSGARPGSALPLGHPATEPALPPGHPAPAAAGRATDTIKRRKTM